MAINSSQSLKSVDPISKAYWICQIAGWATIFLFETGFGFAFRTKESPPFAGALSAAAIICLSGLIITHLLYLTIRRRQWLQKPLRLVCFWLSGALALSAVLLMGVNMFVRHFLLDKPPFKTLLHPQYLILVWVSYVSLFGLWMALYLAVHEFRERRRAEVNALRFELEAQTAQLRGLREQLNPHFLFNCLNSLREMIIENPQSAQAMVTQLSRLLRYSLQSNHIELVPLADELQAVRDYLDLEAVRYEDRLRVLWSIDCHDTSLAVPPMLLQTLVENALKHGIARLPEGGEIAIRITAGDGSKLTMEVVNSGEIAESPSANGIGLRNARSRLQLLYGDGAKMILESMAGHRVLACVTLPLTSSPYLTLPQTPSPDAILPATEARLESSAGR